MRLFGVVVTYFPPSGILDRLAEIANLVDSLVVVDNSANGDIACGMKQPLETLGAKLIANKRNLGIATALNQGVAFAQERGADWVVFFDQDSEPAEEFRDEIDSIRSNYKGAKPLGIIGSNYALADNSNPYYATESSAARNYVLTNDVITSGSAYDMTMLSELGRFKDEYFIDCVDIEYCWRALTNGYAVCRTTKPLLRHALGAPTTRNVFGCKFGTSNHAAFRRYFMARNSVLLFRDYIFRLPRASLRHASMQFKSTLLMCIFEREKFKKLGFVFQGIWHGLFRRTDQMP